MSTETSLLTPGAAQGGWGKPSPPVSCALGVSPSSLLICRNPPALCPPLSHKQRSSTTIAETFLQVYHVLTAPKHAQISNPAHEMFISKEEAVTVLVLGFAELWVAGLGCSPPSAVFCNTC